METVFMILAFIGTFSCGFFACMAGMFAVIMHEQDKQIKKKGGKDGKDKRDQYRPGDVF